MHKRWHQWIRRPVSLQESLYTPPVLAWLTHLILVTVTAIFTVFSTPERDKFRPEFDGLARYLVSPLAVWDGGWYVRIADQGYGSRPDGSAFWPLYPFLLSLAAELTGLPTAVLGVMLSNLFFLAMLMVLFHLVRSDFGTGVAGRTLWLMALWPLSFFFSAVYTESLFTLLAVGTFALARSGKWTGAAFTAAGAVLTRNVGIVIVICLCLLLVQQRGWHPRAWWRQGIQIGTAALALVPFAIHIERLWGDPLLPIRAQNEWARFRSNPWDTLSTAVHRMHHIYATGLHSCELAASRGTLERCQDALELHINSFPDDLAFVTVFGCLALIPFGILKLPIRDSAYLILAFAFPLFNQATYDPLLAMPRYLIVVYPVFIVLALLIRWRFVLIPFLVLSAAAMCGLLYLFGQRYFVA